MNRRTVLNVCVALSGLLASGCVLRPSSPTTASVPNSVESEIMLDLVNELVERFPPPTTPLTLLADAPSPLGERLRTQGYAVHEFGNTNVLTLTAYYLEETGHYLGVLRLGLNFTLARQYVYDDGTLIAGATTAQGGRDE